MGGWDAMTADHARYVFSGMSLLDGRGYVGEAGETFYVRAPAYPLMVGGAYAIAGATGAHLVAWALGVGALLLAVVASTRIGGPVAGAMTAAAIAIVPIFWDQIVSLGIDLPQAAFYLAAVLLIWQPKRVNWLLAGAVFGVALLVKETVAPALVLLPVAWLPVWSGLGWRRWAGLFALFVLAVGVVAGWWWLLVLRETGFIFPLNSIQAIVPAEVPITSFPRGLTLLAWLAAGASWIYLLVARIREPEVRVLVCAGLAMGPALAATIALAQPERNLTILILLSCVAAGVALADLVRARSRLRPTWAPRAVAAAVGLVVVAGVALGQASVLRAVQDDLPGEAAAALRPGLRPGQEVVSSFRSRSSLGVALFDLRVRVELLPVAAVRRAIDPAAYLWLGERNGTLFGLARSGWARVLGSPGVASLALVGPHPLTPSELLPALRSGRGKVPGLRYVDTISEPSGTADIFDVRPRLIDKAPAIPLHAQPNALLHWLDLAEAGGAADTTDATDSLLDAGPVVLADAAGLRKLSDRLGEAACFRPSREDVEPVIVIEREEGQPDCLSPSERQHLS
jgi:hypothetical protein